MTHHTDETVRHSALDKEKKQPFFRRLLVGGSLPVLLIVAILAGFGFYKGSGLELKLSLTDLLPEDHPSVVKFEKITDIVGGVGYLTVVLSAEDKKTHLKVAPALVKGIENNELVRNAFFERDSYFFSSHMLYYLSLPNLKKLNKNINKNIRRSRSNAFDLGLWDEEKISKDKTEIDPKVKEQARSSARITPVLQSKDGKHLLLMIKPTFDSTDLQRTKALIAGVEKVLQETLPSEVTYKFTGRYYQKIADSAVVEKDIFVLGSISLALIALLLFFYVRSVRAVVLIVAPILMGIGCTLGLAYYAIGHINIVTGFLLGILLGLGADYSIHLAFRYKLEKDEGKGSDKDFVWRSLKHSGHAIFVGASAACLAFFLLCLSDFRAFSEFGFICGTGIGAVMIALLGSFSGMTRLMSMDKRNFGGASNPIRLPQLSTKKSFRIAVGFSVFFAIIGTQVSFEYDFSKMLQHSKEVQRLSDLVDEIYERSAVPAVMSAPSKEIAVKTEDFLKERYVPKVIDLIVSGATIVPEDQGEKQRWIKKIKNQVDGIRDKWLEKELDVPASAIRRWVNAEPFDFKDLPFHLQDALRGRTQNDYLMVLYPSTEIRLNTAQGVQTFAGMVRDIEANFPKVLSGSDAVVFAEILDLIKRDAFLILAGIFSVVALIIGINLRSWEGLLYSFIPLVCSFPIGMGLMVLFGIKFNIFNIAIIPSFVAIGIDVPLHIAHRAREVRSGFKAARDLASAVNLTLATTAIGFGVLIFSRAGVLRSLGWLALLGTLSIWWVGLFILPALLEKKYRSEDASKGSGQTSASAPAASSKQSKSSKSTDTRMAAKSAGEGSELGTTRKAPI